MSGTQDSADLTISVSEIDITTCFIDPWYAETLRSDVCAPATTKEDDAYKGKWVRVPRNLNVQSGMMSLVRRMFSTSEGPYI